ncbi:SGNH/GDSL hydrolase family protein [Chelativorans salis]|uniref:SGNH/GDSL hydrolase family protein n=1 Tax=Chelativorans salis TaxID=2978478 RepID=A0ABT2LL98_9HYPH|nr:SGNH/GDSL hydrolase family protein [Chelativorans sp. EGI FJ00035]MCT7375370.1 SGNH/GDSL hydrolase family protein [Chelativorans sp. EGI FJ00035]
MKTILCYGDSLTWGYNTEGPSRHAYEDRWPSVLQARLGDKARVIAEGLNGRTTAFDDWLAGADRNGARILPTLLATHSPLDLVIIMLGANDMKPFICGRAIGAKQGMERLVDIVRGHDYPLDAAAPAILLVAPPVLCDTGNDQFAAMFEGGVAEAGKLAPLYAQLAEETGCAFFDAGSVACTTSLDGVHLDAGNTRAIGVGLEPAVRQILGL